MPRKPLEKYQRLFGTQLKRRFDKAFANVEVEEVPFLDIQIIEGDIDPLEIKIPVSVKDIAVSMNLDLTSMVNLVLWNFHNQMSGKENSLIELLKNKEPEFLSRFNTEFKSSLKEFNNDR